MAWSLCPTRPRSALWAEVDGGTVPGTASPLRPAPEGYRGAAGTTPPGRRRRVRPSGPTLVAAR